MLSTSVVEAMPSSTQPSADRKLEGAAFPTITAGLVPTGVLARMAVKEAGSCDAVGATKGAESLSSGSQQKPDSSASSEENGGSLSSSPQSHFSMNGTLTTTAIAPTGSESHTALQPSKDPAVATVAAELKPPSSSSIRMLTSTSTTINLKNHVALQSGSLQPSKDPENKTASAELTEPSSSSSNQTLTTTTAVCLERHAARQHGSLQPAETTVSTALKEPSAPATSSDGPPTTTADVIDLESHDALQQFPVHLSKAPTKAMGSTEQKAPSSSETQTSASYGQRQLIPVCRARVKIVHDLLTDSYIEIPIGSDASDPSEEVDGASPDLIVFEQLGESQKDDVNRVERAHSASQALGHFDRPSSPKDDGIPSVEMAAMMDDSFVIGSVQPPKGGRPILVQCFAVPEAGKLEKVVDILLDCAYAANGKVAQSLPDRNANYGGLHPNITHSTPVKDEPR